MRVRGGNESPLGSFSFCAKEADILSILGVGDPAIYSTDALSKGGLFRLDVPFLTSISCS